MIEQQVKQASNFEFQQTVRKSLKITWKNSMSYLGEYSRDESLSNSIEKRQGHK